MIINVMENIRADTDFFKIMNWSKQFRRHFINFFYILH